MNFSKKLFTGFTATAVGISLIAGGFSVLAKEGPNGNDAPTQNGNKSGTAEGKQKTESNVQSETVKKDDLPGAKKEYKTEAEITARINELKKDQGYLAYADAQKKLETFINKAIEILDGLKLNSATGEYEVKDKNEKVLKTVGPAKVEAAKGMLNGLRKDTTEGTYKSFVAYEGKLADLFGKDSDIYKYALDAKDATKERNDSAKSPRVKVILEEIATLEAKLAELKKANKNTDNKSSDNKSSDSKKQETNKNQKSSNGTNNATATKKADATKIKTGVE